MKKLDTLNPKIKYLLDECVSFKTTGLTKRNAITSKEILPTGTPDDEILKAIQKHNLLLITADLRFSFKTSITTGKAFYQTQDGERYRLTAKLVAINYFRYQNKKLTNYLKENETIVIP